MVVSSVLNCKLSIEMETWIEQKGKRVIISSLVSLLHSPLMCLLFIKVNKEKLFYLQNLKLETEVDWFIFQIQEPMILQSKEHWDEIIMLKALNFPLPLLLSVTSLWFHPVPHLPVSAPAHSWPSESLWKFMADFNRSWQEGEMSWILKSFDDNVKLDGRESPVMHPVWEKLQPFLDIRVSPWELSLELSWSSVSSLLMELILPF